MARALKIALPVAILATGFAVAGILAATREPTEARPAEERAWPVETVTVRFADVRPVLRFYGEIAARREVDLRALAAGPVVRVAAEFAPGGAVRAGAELVAVDPFDHERTVAERAAERDEARARLAGERELLAEDAAQVAIGERDLARQESLFGGAVSERRLDEARMALSQARSRHIQRRRDVDVQTARLARLEAALARAERALADTVLRAPFDGWLADTAAQAGKRLGVGDRVARLIDRASLEARFHLPDAAFGRALQGALGGPATVVWRLGPKTARFAATIDRIDGEIDPGTGGVTAYARIEDDGGALFDSLRPGAFVEVLVPDRLYRQVVRLPATALHAGAGGGDTVYAVVGGRLEARAVEIAGRDGGAVLASGELNEGDAVAVTRLTEIGPGLRVAAR